MKKDFTIIHLGDDRSVKAGALRTLFPQLANGKYKVEVSSAKQRSIQQNRYYWSVVVNMVKEGMYEKGHELTAEETHEFLKGRFNSKEVVNEDTGECIQVPLSTTRLMTIGFMEYIEKIQRFAAEWLQIAIPDPNQQMELSYE